MCRSRGACYLRFMCRFRRLIGIVAQLLVMPLGIPSEPVAGPMASDARAPAHAAMVHGAREAQPNRDDAPPAPCHGNESGSHCNAAPCLPGACSMGAHCASIGANMRTGHNLGLLLAGRLLPVQSTRLSSVPSAPEPPPPRA